MLSHVTPENPIKTTGDDVVESPGSSARADPAYPAVKTKKSATKPATHRI